jgi:energy-converting hydrogenase A subunit M
MMKHLFICFTPLQLINAINIKISQLQDDEVTLYILDYSHNHQEMYEKAIASKLFVRVQLVKTLAFIKHWSYRFKVTRYLVKGIQYWNHDYFSSKLVDDVEVYDKLWISYIVHASWLLFLTNKAKNKNIELIFLEDGIGSYRLLTMQLNRWEVRLLHLMGYKTYLEEMKELYVYEPDLVLNTLCPDVEIFKLPKINKPKVKNVINSICLKSDQLFEPAICRYLFFEAPYQSQKVIKQQTSLIDIFAKKLKKDFCIKLHPRSEWDSDKYKAYVLDIDLPVELLCLNRDLSDNVLISVLSTACITPKLMFDQEPVLIFLYKLVDIYSIGHMDEMYIQFIERFARTYRDPEKVFIPDSVKELKNLIDQLGSSH